MPIYADVCAEKNTRWHDHGDDDGDGDDCRSMHMFVVRKSTWWHDDGDDDGDDDCRYVQMSVRSFCVRCCPWSMELRNQGGFLTGATPHNLYHQPYPGTVRGNRFRNVISSKVSFCFPARSLPGNVFLSVSGQGS